MAGEAEAPVTLTLLIKDLATAELASFRKSLNNLGSEAMNLLNSQLTQALSLGAIFVGLKKAFEATDELEQSQRILAATAQIANVRLQDLYDIANNLHDNFFLTSAEANNFTTAITRLTIEAGEFNKTQEATIAFLQLGAARGFTLEGTSRALENAYVGVYRTAQRLIGQNLPNLFKEQAVSMGLTVQQLTASERAHILLNAALEAGETARGSYAKWLETAQGQTQIMNQKTNEAEVSIGNALRPIRLLGLEVFSFLADKIRDFVGGIQLMAVDISEWGDYLRAFSLRVQAIVYDFFAQVVAYIKIQWPGIGVLLFGKNAEADLTHHAQILRNQADQMVDDIAKDVEDRYAAILKGFNAGPEGAGPPGPPRPPDVAPDIRLVEQLNNEIARWKDLFRDGQISAVQFGGELDRIRNIARQTIIEKGSALSQEGWKGLQGVINATTGDIHTAAEQVFKLLDASEALSDNWNKLQTITINWREELKALSNEFLNNFINTVDAAFQALVDGSQNAAAAFAKGMIGAVAAVAKSLSQMYIGKAAAEIAEGISEFPFGSQHFAAAAQFTAAATLLAAIGGAIQGGANRIGGGGGGGGGGTTVSSINKTAAQNQLAEATIIIEGGILDMSDPRQADAFAKAVAQLTGRRVFIQGRS